MWAGRDRVEEDSGGTTGSDEQQQGGGGGGGLAEPNQEEKMLLPALVSCWPRTVAREAPFMNKILTDLFYFVART